VAGDNDDDTSEDEDDKEDPDTIIEIDPDLTSKVPDLSETNLHPVVMLGKKKKNFSLSSEHLPAAAATSAVSSVPGEPGGRRQLAVSHPDMYQIVEAETAAARKATTKTGGGGLKRSLKKLRQVFRSSPKLNESAVYKAVDFQNSINQNPIYIAR
jgi:hypothetical protein